MMTKFSALGSSTRALGGWLAAVLGLMFAASPALAADPAASGRHGFRYQKLERSYVLRLPVAMPKSGTRLPLVLVLHGGGGDAANAEAMTGFTETAQREGFIVVYPEGTGRFAHRLLTWNAGHCCGRAMEGQVDDVGFIRELLARLEAELPVDDKRIYVTGMSNGGMMAHRLGIELSDRLAAIAPVVAAVFGDEKKPEHAVAALMINGQKDTHVPVAGGVSAGRFADAWDGVPLKPAAAQASFWAAANGCEEWPTLSEQGVVKQWRHACPAGHEVELMVVGDNAHAWPGGQAGSRRADPPSQSLDATEAIWDFFKAHSK